MKWLVLILLLISCSNRYSFPTNEIKEYSKPITIEFKEQPRLLTLKDGKYTFLNVGGYYKCTKDLCKIVLSKKDGLTCLEHELKHVVYGNFHDHNPNRTYCRGLLSTGN